MQPILLFGGMSDERLVSVASAQNVLSTLPHFTPWFIAPDGAVSEVTAADLAAHTKPFETQFVSKAAPFAKDMNEAADKVGGRAIFVCLHGDEGEDGTLQRLFEEKKIPFTGSGSSASRACFDKLEAKRRVAERGVAVAAQLELDVSDASKLAAVLKDFARLHKKIVVKPVSSGSSVGLHIVTDEDDLDKVAKAVCESGFDYMAEQFLMGREITVGVADHQGKLTSIAPSEVLVQKGFAFDYQGKYLGRGITEVTPAELSNEEAHACLELALQVHRDLGCYGYSRSDMILTAQGPIFLETNTLPGMSKSSFVPQQLAAKGIALADFVNEQLQLALKRPQGA